MSLEQPTDTPILGVGGVVFRAGDGGQIEILLIKKRFGYWTLPKGKVEPGESDAAAVVREVQEETGILGTAGAPIHAVSYMIVKKNRMRPKTVTYYLVRAHGGTLLPDKKEHIVKVRWFTLRAALKRIKRGRVRKVVQHASVLLPASPRAKAS